jgi:hypothetical protein
MKPMTNAERYDRRQSALGQLTQELQRTRRFLSMKDIARLLHQRLTPRERYELIRYLNRPKI